MLSQDLDRKNSVTDAHIHPFSFPFGKILFRLDRNIPAMPLNDAQIGGFFYAPSIRA